MTILASTKEMKNHSHKVSTCKKSIRASVAAALAVAVILNGTLVAERMEAAESASALFKKGQAEYAAKKYKEAKATFFHQSVRLYGALRALKI